MQTGKEQLAQQQAIMQARGFYKGKLDGVWGPETIAAKIKWERSGKFAPAIPNNGFPLGDRGPYPKGVYKQPNNTLTCAEIEVQRATQQQQQQAKPQQDKQADKPEKKDEAV